MSNATVRRSYKYIGENSLQGCWKLVFKEIIAQKRSNSHISFYTTCSLEVDSLVLPKGQIYCFQK